MTIALRTEQVRAIEAHARETYPEECCGFLLGLAAEPKIVQEARRARNTVKENREIRYAIDPREILRTERDAATRGIVILGFYHSHPNHPARPSEFDLTNAAWPGYSYVILSIVDRNPNDMRSWILDPQEGTVLAEVLSITP